MKKVIQTNASSEPKKYAGEVEGQKHGVIFSQQLKFVFATFNFIFATLMFVFLILIWLALATMKFVFAVLKFLCGNITSTKASSDIKKVLVKSRNGNVKARKTNKGTMLNKKLKSADHIKDDVKKNSDLTAEMKRLEEENVDLITRMQRLEGESCKIENNNLKTINELLRRIIKLMSGKPMVTFLPATTEVQRLQNENTDLTKTIQCLKDENVDLITRMQFLEGENNQKTIENIDLKKVNELLHEDNNNIIQQLQETNTNKNNEIRQHKENNSNLSNEIEQLREENDDMSKEIQDLHQKNNNMEIEIEQLQEYTMCSFITESGTVAVSNEVLGKGGWGAVYTGDFYGTKVAVKEFYEIILSPHNMEILKREINIASQCRHPNLLQFICATRDAKNQLLIVTELMDMALRAFLEQQARENSRLKHPEVKLISLDVARGLNYLHSKKPHPIIHRDVSSANVLLWIENGSVRRAKLSDYGAANFMQACNTSNPGAALYAAPEARRAQHDPKIDVYSYGLLVCEMTNCELPDPEQIRRKRQITRIPNAGIKELVEECTKMDPRERPTMQDVIERWQEI